MMNKVEKESSKDFGQPTQALKLQFKPVSSGEFVNFESKKRPARAE